jgi:hypothetical protein
MNVAMKPSDVATQQMACPLSVGQAEAGRYTYCIAEKCMAWRWKKTEIDIIDDADEIPQGWELNRVVSDDQIEIRKIPTHGYCGMVPLEKD